MKKHKIDKIRKFCNYKEWIDWTVFIIINIYLEQHFKTEYFSLKAAVQLIDVFMIFLVFIPK